MRLKISCSFARDSVSGSYILALLMRKRYEMCRNPVGIDERGRLPQDPTAVKKAVYWERLKVEPRLQPLGDRR